MKNLNKKGFTLIELLAVITIMGILMLVAIPAVSGLIENTRKDTFLDTAKEYVNGVKTLWISDGLECKESGGTTYVSSSALSDGTYYVQIDSAQVDSGSGVGPGSEFPIILEDGGKSAWGSRDVKGYVQVVVATTTAADDKKVRDVKYYVALSDNVHGINDISMEASDLKRGNVKVEGVTYPAPTGTFTYCKEV